MKVKSTFFLAGIVLSGLLLRAFRLEENFVFTAEFGDNLLEIKNAIVDKKLPLVGPQTSHSWLFFGPIYYWIMMLVVRIFGFDPLVAGFFGVLTGTLVILLNFFVIKQIFNFRVALFSSFLIAVSPLWVSFSRDARIFFFVTPLFYLLLWSLNLVWKGEAKYLFWAGLFYGAMFSFHFSPIVLLPAILLFFILKKSPAVNVLKFFAGLLTVNVPMLLYDSKNGFRMILSLIAWVPYRIAGFLGFYPKNSLTKETFLSNIEIINKFFGENLTLEESLWPLFSLMFLVISVYFMIKKFSFNKPKFEWIFLLTLLISALAAVFIHQDAPIHYFLPIFSLPPIIFALYLEKFRLKRSVTIILVLTILVATFGNIKNFLVPGGLYNRGKEASLSPHLVPYNLQKEVAKLIVEDAKDASFFLKRVGPYDYFEEDYEQNYRYLLWLYGNEPKEKSDVTYTIYEDTKKVPSNAREVFWIGNIAVTKDL